MNKNYVNFNYSSFVNLMLKIFSNTFQKKIGSYTPSLLSNKQRGLYWAPKQYFLPESQIAKMKRLIASQYDGKETSKWQTVKIQTRYLLKVSAYLVIRGTKQFIKDVKWRYALLTDKKKR